MIKAIITDRHWGNGINENANTLYVSVNFVANKDIPELDFEEGDVVESTKLSFSNPSDLNRIVRDWLTSIVNRLNDKIINSEFTPIEITLPEVVDTTIDPISQAKQEYNQKRQSLITAKQDLDIGLISQEEFNSIKSETLFSKETMQSAVSELSI